MPCISGLKRASKSLKGAPSHQRWNSFLTLSLHQSSWPYVEESLAGHRFVWLQVLLLARGFLQILPAFQTGSEACIVELCVKISFLYYRLQIVLLTENLRLQLLFQDPAETEEAVQFSQLLPQAGKGKASSDAGSCIKVPHYIYNVCGRGTCANKSKKT